MIDKLNAQNLGQKVKVGERTGTISGYHNAVRAIIVKISGEVEKFNYDQVELIEK